MKALRFHGVKDLRLDEIDEPICGKHQVKVRPAFVGICGTVILGHEISGTIVEVGSDVTSLSSGDEVAVFPLLCDSTCSVCLQGRPNCCRNFGSIGFSGGAGGFSEYLVVSPENLYKLPKGLDIQIGALVEPLSVAWHAVSVSHFQVDDDVLVVGAGPIGIGIVQVLKARGASNVVVSEMSQIRRELAMKFGADHVFEPSNGTAVAQCKALCRDEGPAVVFDAAGVQAGLDLALASSRAGATIVNVAAWKFPPQFDALLLTMGEKKYIGTMTYLRQDFEQVLDALETGSLRPKGMVTSTISLVDVEEKGFKSLIGSKDQNLKIMVRI